MTISEWQTTIARIWPFTSKTYPFFTDDCDAIRHVVLHQNKDAGRLAAAIEPVDHGHPPDRVLARRAVRNSLVNTLRLCDLLDLSAEDLLRDYENEQT